MSTGTTPHEHDHESCKASGNCDDKTYAEYLERIQRRFSAALAEHTHLFTTDARALYDLYLASFPAGPVRQHHTCTACQHFIERFGGLVVIDAAGNVSSPIWSLSDAPTDYQPAVMAILKAISKASVTGIFLSPDRVYGVPKTGVWQHLAVTVKTVFRHPRLTAEQVMAERLEDFKNVTRALGEFKLEHLEQAVTLLKSDALYRSEKVLGQGEWLLRVQQQYQEEKNRKKRDTLLWREIALAPAGFCHPRASMIGSLLEDLAAGLPFADVSAKFRAKMDPTQYQRPQAAPSAGALAAAEKIVEQLGSAGALRRRFARLEDVKLLWGPKETEKATPAGGVFGHLQPKNEVPAPKALEIPLQKMTWVKFATEVLPSAAKVEIFAPFHGFYGALVTAVNPEAPPILQWDTEEHRNPVSWYVWTGGCRAEQMEIAGGRYHDLTGVTENPSMWNGGFEHQGKGLIFLIKDARESRDPSLCLFPEILKAEYREIRSSIEAFSKAGKLEGKNEQSAAGLLTGGGREWNIKLRVTTPGRQPLEYLIDRWD